MRSFRIVPDEPVKHIEIKSMNVEHFSLVIIDIFLLNRPVESFTMGVHLRSLGIGVPMREIKTS